MRQMRRMEIEALPAESPRTVSEYVRDVTVEAGSDLDKTSYIKEMTDDADSQKTLFDADSGRRRGGYRRRREITP